MLDRFAFGTRPRLASAAAASGAAGEMWHATTSTLTGFGSALTSSKSADRFGSIVGITQVPTPPSKRARRALRLPRLHLPDLAVINLFPFLPLDGGHVLWTVAEKLRGRRISLIAMYRFSSVGIVADAVPGGQRR